jgi:peptide/nickel transport system permease protein
MRRLVHRLGWPGTIALACVLGFIAVGILAPWIAPIRRRARVRRMSPPS